MGTICRDRTIGQRQSEQVLENYQVDRLGFLYDNHLLSLPAATGLKVSGYPEAVPFDLPSANRASDSLERFNALYRPDFFGTVGAIGDRLSLCNKRPPHSITDVMLIQSDDDIRSRFQDLSEAQKVAALRTARAFETFTADQVASGKLGPGMVHISYNVSPDTRDRENSMGYTKRFHMHLNYWPHDTVQNLTVMPVGRMPRHKRRDFLDPFTQLAAEVLSEQTAVRGWFPDGTVLDPGAEATLRRAMPPAFTVQFPSWNFLTSDVFRQQLTAMQLYIDSRYRDIQEAFTGIRSPAAEWRRHHVLDAATVKGNLRALGFDSVTDAKLSKLAEIVRSIDDRTCEYLRKKARFRTDTMLMNGPNYSVGFFSEIGSNEHPARTERPSVWMMVQFKLLSSLGSAGLFPSVKAPIVRISRNAEPISAADRARRSEFQRDFASWIGADD